MSSSWVRWLPWVSLGAFSALWIARWPTFPLVLDPYYHLFIAQQIVDAGGPIAYEWCEYAPIGRPHLYPPLLHLVLAGLLSVGCPPLIAIRLVTAALPIALLVSLYLVMRRLFTPSIALSCLWMALLPFSFQLHSAITLAATLAAVELLWLLDALERGRGLSAAVLIALLGYTHLGLLWIGLLMIGLSGLLRPAVRPTLHTAALGFVAVLPWWWHLWSHRALLHPVPRYENDLIEFLPLLVAAALLGGWVCWRRRGRFLSLIACWVGYSVLVFQYTFRWVSGEGVLPLVLLAGVGVEWLSQQLSSRRQLAFSAGLAVLIGLSPTAAQQASGWQLLWPDSSPFHLLGTPWAHSKELEVSLAGQFTEALSRVVSRHSAPREILWSNAPYVLGLVAVMAHRPMSSAMFSEVQASQTFDPVEAAHLIVWFKFAPIPGEVRFARLSNLQLTKVYEDQVTTLYRRQEPLPLAAKPKAALPLWLAWGIVASALGLIAWDARRSRHATVTTV